MLLWLALSKTGIILAQWKSTESSVFTEKHFQIKMTQPLLLRVRMLYIWRRKRLREKCYQSRATCLSSMFLQMLQICSLNISTMTINCLGKQTLACFRRAIQAISATVTLNKALLKLLKTLLSLIKRTVFQEPNSLQMDLLSGIKQLNLLTLGKTSTKTCKTCLIPSFLRAMTTETLVAMTSLDLSETKKDVDPATPWDSFRLLRPG